MLSTDKLEYIIDANVLIDYLEADMAVLALLSRNIGQLYLARSVFDEIVGLTESTARKNKITIVTPSLELAIQAAAKRGRLSYQDHETLLIAKENDWECITNDKLLRQECSKEGVRFLWGLEPMKTLVAGRHLSKTDAKKIANMIHVENSRYITSDILKKFIEQIDSIVL